MLMDPTFLTVLEQREKLARGGKWRRLWFAPVRYLFGQFFQKIIYPRRKRGRLAEAITFWGGHMNILLPSAMDIFLLGLKTHPSEIRLTRFLLQKLRPGQVFVDVGAHYGFFSLLAAELVGRQGKVYALEPAPATFSLLEKNLRHTPQARARQVAAGDQAGNLHFYEFPTLYAEYNSLHPEQFSNARWRPGNDPKVHQVQGIILDQFCRQENLTPDLIKIDVEGAEAAVVRGMTTLLQSPQPPFIVMEYLTDERQNEAHREATRLLKNFGLNPFRIQEDGSLLTCPNIEAYLLEKGLDSDNIVFHQ